MIGCEDVSICGRPKSISCRIEAPKTTRETPAQMKAPVHIGQDSLDV